MYLNSSALYECQNIKAHTFGHTFWAIKSIPPMKQQRMRFVNAANKSDNNIFSLIVGNSSFRMHRYVYLCVRWWWIEWTQQTRQKTWTRAPKKTLLLLPVSRASSVMVQTMYCCVLWFAGGFYGRIVCAHNSCMNIENICCKYVCGQQQSASIKSIKPNCILCVPQIFGAIWIV